jgi:hypothetical protein
VPNRVVGGGVPVALPNCSVAFSATWSWTAFILVPFFLCAKNGSELRILSMYSCLLQSSSVLPACHITPAITEYRDPPT